MIRLSRMNHLFMAATAMTASMAAAEIFEYQIGPVPGVYGDCAAVQSSVASNFVKASGIQPFNVVCKTRGDKSMSVRVSYQAAEALKITSTYDDAPSLTVGQGLYKTMEECLSDSATRVQEFEEQTGLSAMNHFCLIEDQYVRSSYPVSLMIDAVGSTVRPYHFMSSILGDSVTSGVDALLNELTQYINSQRSDVLIAKAVVREDYMRFQYIGIGYYAATPLKIDRKVFVRFPKGPACVAELNEIRRGVIESETKLAAAACIGMNKLYEAQLFFNGALKASMYDTGTVFKTYEECTAQRAQVLADFQQSLGAQAKSAICVPGLKEVEVMIVVAH